jgi:hypothetical protein
MKRRGKAHGLQLGRSIWRRCLLDVYLYHGVIDMLSCNNYEHEHEQCSLDYTYQLQHLTLDLSLNVMLSGTRMICLLQGYEYKHSAG